MKCLCAHLVIGLLAASPAAFAQEYCAAFGKYGIYDFDINTSDQQSSESFRSFYCEQNFQSEGEARQFNADMSIPIEGVPVGIAFGEGESRFLQTYRAFCDSRSFDRDYASKTVSFVKTINSDMLDLFKRCVERDGLHAWLSPAADPQNFYVDLSWRPDTGDPFHTLETFTVQGATCPAELKVGLRVSPEGRQFLCTRNPENAAVDIAISATRKIIFDTPLQLRAIEQPAAPPPIPPTLQTVTKYVASPVAVGTAESCPDGMKVLECKSVANGGALACGTGINESGSSCLFGGCNVPYPTTIRCGNVGTIQVLGANTSVQQVVTCPSPMEVASCNVLRFPDGAACNSTRVSDDRRSCEVGSCGVGYTAQVICAPIITVLQ